MSGEGARKEGGILVGKVWLSGFIMVVLSVVIFLVAAVAVFFGEAGRAIFNLPFLGIKDTYLFPLVVGVGLALVVLLLLFQDVFGNRIRRALTHVWVPFLIGFLLIAGVLAFVGFKKEALDRVFVEGAPWGAGVIMLFVVAWLLRKRTSRVARVFTRFPKTVFMFVVKALRRFVCAPLTRVLVGFLTFVSRLYQMPVRRVSQLDSSAKRIMVTVAALNILVLFTMGFEAYTLQGTPWALPVLQGLSGLFLLVLVGGVVALVWRLRSSRRTVQRA
ncbi:MAG: hypothetical protein HYS57_01775 [Parcubacteria group bacterium]|nr:hypothetical protein [Parcubacteria group bacterium]